MKNLIENKTIKYSLFRFYVNLFYRFYYKKIEIIGVENIPWGKPIILAPNHQNALMDAFAFVLWKNFQPVWLARADIFNKKTSDFLNFTKIMPIYRMRDGISQLGKNEEIFNAAVRILKKSKVLCLFPEATHSSRRKLLPVKKGVQRIAFMAQEKTDFSLDIQILPVGLYYTNYFNFNHKLLINFGKPIDQKEYNKLYKEDQRKAFVELGNRIGEELDKLAVNIPSGENYDLYESFHEIFLPCYHKNNNIRKPDLSDDLNAIKSIDKKLWEVESNNREKFEILLKLNNKYRAKLKKYNLRDWVVRNEKFGLGKFFINGILLLLGLPFFILGFVTNAIPFYIPDKKIKSVLKDPQFISSFNFAIGLIVFPIFYIFIALLISVIFGNFWLMFSIILMPFIGKLAFNWIVIFKKTVAMLKFSFFKKTRFVEIIELRKSIIDNFSL
jgi:1-acyl-sn-glycerol-3-phosphate acyltransferase